MSDAFAPLLGQPQAVTLLKQAVQHNRIAPAYLFVGPAGVGRRLGAQCFLEVLCRLPSPRHPVPPSVDLIQRQLSQGNHPDVLWVEPTYLVQKRLVPARQAIAEGLNPKSAPQIRLEQVREISQFLSRSPLSAARNLVVLEGVETLSENAANGLLKTLEEPGMATLILLAPTLESVLPTIASRCQRIPFYRLPPNLLAAILQQQHAPLLENPILLKMAEGSPGEALQIGQWLAELPDSLGALTQRLPTTPQGALDSAKQIAKELSLEAQVWFIGYLQHCHWNPQSPQISGKILQRLEETRLHLKRSVNPRLAWEVTLLELVTPIPP